MPDCGTAYPGAMIGGLAVCAAGFGGGSASSSQRGHTECRQFGSQHHKLRLIESTPPAPKPFSDATPPMRTGGCTRPGAFIHNDLGRVACLH
jgi:hypothetical protein